MLQICEHPAKALQHAEDDNSTLQEFKPPAAVLLSSHVLYDESPYRAFGSACLAVSSIV